MNILIKEGVVLIFIDDKALTVFNVVSEAFRLYGGVALLTSAADGIHGKDSYHNDGHAWDFRAMNDRLCGKVYRAIRFTLKSKNSCYDTVFEKQKGNEHFHIEYDDRRADEIRRNPASLDIDNQKLREDEKMAKETTYKFILSVVVALLGPLLKLITKKFRDELTTWVTSKYAEALATENPFDDLFFEFLIRALDLPIPFS